MSRTLTLDLFSPGWIESTTGIVRVRLEARDGSRGVLPGHEASRFELIAGPVELTLEDDTQRFIATEGGLVWIERDRVRIATAWACAADELSELAEAVRSRVRLRAESEAEARAVAHRHEKAAQRALVALRRKEGR